MQRRKFITILGGAAAAWPLAAHAQQPPIPRIGVVRISARGESPHFEDALRQGLAQAGYAENRDVASINGGLKATTSAYRTY